MARVVDAFREWARRTSSSFSELRDSTLQGRPESLIEDGQVYRLREWPALPPALRTAKVLRLLSLMSTRPVNRSWILGHTGLSADGVDALLKRLVNQEAVEVIDIRQFGSGDAV